MMSENSDLQTVVPLAKLSLKKEHTNKLDLTSANGN